MRLKATDYVLKGEADNWFQRNQNNKGHNIFTEYLLNIFDKKDLKKFNIAEFGIGHSYNISLLSHYVKNVDGYDGSRLAISRLNNMRKIFYNIDGKQVIFGNEFQVLKKYDLIIFGFFTYMLDNNELKKIIDDSYKFLNEGGYLYIYDFLHKENISKKDIHNKNFYIYKRNFSFYLEKFQNFNLVDFRLMDNKYLEQYMKIGKLTIDHRVSDENDWVFSALFKKDKYDE